MIITFHDAGNLKFPQSDEAINEACHLLNWELITKVLVGEPEGLQAAVRRYFSPIRKVVGVKNDAKRFEKADLIIYIRPKGNFSLQGLGTSTLIFYYEPRIDPSDYEVPW